MVFCIFPTSFLPVSFHKYELASNMALSSKEIHDEIDIFISMLYYLPKSLEDQMITQISREKIIYLRS